MSSIRPQDRASLCTFTFADGRRCRTPLSSSHPRLCFDHARKDAQAHAPDPPRTDLSFFFSGEWVSAYDLSAVIARLMPEVAHGQCNPKIASTVASLSRTMVRTIQLSQHEFISTHADERLPRPRRRPNIPAKRALH
ncbi:MAG: hypothetical protein WA765_00875 [Candidatus Acidiferrum sp.]